MPARIEITQAEYVPLMREVKRGLEFCKEVAELKFKLIELSRQLDGLPIQEEVKKTIEACTEVSRLVIEIAAFRRRLKELDPETTPVNPPSVSDVEATFRESSRFGRRKKTPPGTPGAR